MITKETNERLTQTGPGTPGGNFLRRYWFPVAAVSELDKEPVLPVRILGENLTLFRVAEGPGAGGQGTDASPAPDPRSPTPRYGLIAERCAHRGLSLAYGIPQENGLRCAYHGWTYDVDGRVVDMPFEPACLPLRVTSYPVEVLGGLVFAYLGPEPRPLLPRWGAFAREDLDTRISFHPLPCNWVQCMDNSMDPIHFEHLHGHYGNYLLKLRGEPPGIDTNVVHLKIDFDVRDPGLIYKRRLITGEREDSFAWTVGHPIVFPYMLCSATGGLGFQIRVPIDDTRTVHIGYGRSEPKEPGHPQVSVAHVELEYDELGRVNRSRHVIVPQDMMAWVAQGPVSDRTQEHLATSDKGVILFHNLILEGIEKVERGEDPFGVIRDPEVNEPMIEIPTSPLGREHETFYLPGRVRERF